MIRTATQHDRAEQIMQAIQNFVARTGRRPQIDDAARYRRRWRRGERPGPQPVREIIAPLFDRRPARPPRPVSATSPMMRRAPLRLFRRPSNAKKYGLKPAMFYVGEGVA